MDTLRPTDWNEYVGQERLKQELDVRIESAIIDDRPLDHVLLCATPGAGKTSLAEMIAAKLEEPIEIVTMPIGIKVLTRLVSNFAGVLLLDELHRASARDQEVLLPLLEFGYVQDTSGRRTKAGWLTIVGATTERQDLIDPLVDRFPIKPEWDDYTDGEMAVIVQGMARKAGIVIDHDSALAFGRASTGTPRKARQFVLAYRDLANSQGRTPSIEDVLELCNTHSDGLTRQHVKYLETLNALGGAKGLSVLCSLLQRSTSEVTEIERLLLQKEYLTYGDRGRELTSAGVTRARGGRETNRNPRRGAG